MDYNQQQQWQQATQQGQGIPQMPQMPQDPQEVPPMDFVTAVKTCFQKFGTFTGRATRAEFWWWQLFTFLVGIVMVFIPILGWAVIVALWVPSWAVAWRRFHDIGMAGGFYFISWIPLIGLIICILWWCQPSEMLPNRFGPVPPAA